MEDVAEVAGDESEIDSKRLQLEQKRVFFNLKENARGKFLKVGRRVLWTATGVANRRRRDDAALLATRTARRV
jgi:hypothetical protein